MADARAREKGVRTGEQVSHARRKDQACIEASSDTFRETILVVPPACRHAPGASKAGFAAKVFGGVPADDGRAIQIAWLRNGTYPGMAFSQQLTFPCESPR